MREKPKYSPRKEELSRVHSPTIPESPYHASGRQRADKGIGQRQDIAIYDDAVWPDSSVELELSIQPVDRSEVEEFLDKDYDDD